MKLEVEKISELLTTKISLRIETCCIQILKPLKPRKKFSEIWLLRVNLTNFTVTKESAKSIRFIYALFETLEPLFNQVFSLILFSPNLRFPEVIFTYFFIL
jgi:hypothetical protein